MNHRKMTEYKRFLLTFGSILCCLLILCGQADSTVTGESSQKGLCAGLYCGRINGTGECVRCPRGYRTDGRSCRKCDGHPTLYDWLYLTFMAIFTLLLHWTYIYHYDYDDGLHTNVTILLQLSALLESLLAALFTLLITEPKGSLSINTCGVKQLADWYTVFFNPKPDHVHEVHCTQEAVYPYYTMVLYYYAFSVLLLLVIRPALSVKFCNGERQRSIYAALYFLPVTAMAHACAAGLIYYSYSYLVMVGSVLSTAIVLAKKNITSFSEVFAKKDVMIILVGHWFLHAFALVALTEWTKPKVHGPLFLLVVFPSLFYLMTVKLSDPRKIKTI